MLVMDVDTRNFNNTMLILSKIITMVFVDFCNKGVFEKLFLESSGVEA